jgi:hypothetical protein
MEFDGEPDNRQVDGRGNLLVFGFSMDNFPTTHGQCEYATLVLS